MADERYQWLDLEAAERLLRGDRVESVDDHARKEADRLAEALDSARPDALAGPAPLPGEEAAMAAFRAVTRTRAAMPLPAPAPGPADLGGVRLGAPAGRGRKKRWTRSVRFGLAASIAGLAVGGVAVAAGTGVLPTPFDAPEPGSSVSAAATPGEEDSETPDGGDGSSRTPGADGNSSTEPSPSATGGPSPTPTATGGDDGTPKDGPDTATPGKDGATKARFIAACLDLRAGRIDSEDRRRLSSATQGGQSVKNFCDRLLAEAEKSGDSGGSDGSGGSGDTGSGTGDGGQTGRTSGDDSGSGGDTGSGGDRASGTDSASTPLPLISFRSLSPQPVAADGTAAPVSDHAA